MAKKSNRHLKIVTAFTVLSLGLIFFLYRGLQVNPNVVPSVLINKPAQDFTALTLQGEEFLPENSSQRFSLSSLKGKDPNLDKALTAAQKKTAGMLTKMGIQIQYLQTVCPSYASKINMTKKTGGCFRHGLRSLFRVPS